MDVHSAMEDDGTMDNNAGSVDMMMDGTMDDMDMDDMDDKCGCDCDSNDRPVNVDPAVSVDLLRTARRLLTRGLLTVVAAAVAAVLADLIVVIFIVVVVVMF